MWLSTFLGGKLKHGRKYCRILYCTSPQNDIFIANEQFGIRDNALLLLLVHWDAAQRYGSGSVVKQVKQKCSF